MWVSLVASVTGLLNKVAPFLVAFFAYMKGVAAEKEQVDKANLEKEKEYAEIAASKPDTIDDDLDRMHTGTF